MRRRTVQSTAKIKTASSLISNYISRHISKRERLRQDKNLQSENTKQHDSPLPQNSTRKTTKKANTSTTRQLQALRTTHTSAMMGKKALHRPSQQLQQLQPARDGEGEEEEREEEEVENPGTAVPRLKGTSGPSLAPLETRKTEQLCPLQLPEWTLWRFPERNGRTRTSL